MNKIFSKRFITLALLILAAALTRLVPHYPNFTAVGAMALFGGAYYGRKLEAFIVPLSAMFLTDLIIGFHSELYAVYLAFVLTVLIGTMLNKKTVLSTFLAASVSSVSFFIITNLAVWMNGLWYPKTAAGLVLCFTAAIPFFPYSYFGDLFFVAVLFGSFELLKVKRPVLA